jgi:hypothetical protein
MELLRIFLDENFKALPDPKRDLIYINIDNFGSRQSRRKRLKLEDFEVMYIVPHKELMEKSPEELQEERKRLQENGDSVSHGSKPIKNIGDNSLYGGSVYSANSRNSRNSRNSKNSKFSVNSRNSRKSKNSYFSGSKNSKQSQRSR